MPRRDLFTDFERMRREMDELMGAFWERPIVGPRRAARVLAQGRRLLLRRGVAEGGGEGRPRRTADLSAVNLEITGRELVISGERPVQETEGRVYQQLEIETGPFRRVIGSAPTSTPRKRRRPTRTAMLRVVLPLVEQREEPHSVPVRRLEE